MTCGYGEDKDLKLVELPYKGGELSMVVILPKLPDGLSNLERDWLLGTVADTLAAVQQLNTQVVLRRTQDDPPSH